MDLLSMRHLFTSSQHLHNQQKCLQKIKQLYEQYSMSDEFKYELIRNICLTLKCDPKSPFTKHVIEFISNILRSFSSTNDSSVLNTNQTNSKEENDMSYDENSPTIGSQNSDTISFKELSFESHESQSFLAQNNSRSESTSNASKSETYLTDFIVKELLVNNLYSVNNKCRYNTCVLIRKLFTHLEDMDKDVYNCLKKALLDRCVDKDKTIRSVSALALHRFQEVDDQKDLVMTALKFHLKNDPDFHVRQSCLQSLYPSKHTTDYFIHATRDVNDIIRKTAFKIIADKLHIKMFEIDKRLQILKNGVNERSVEVKKVFQTKLIPKWVKTFDDDLVSLLFALDIQSDPNLIEKMLYLYFTHINNNCNNKGITGFHKLLDKFRDEFLDERNLLSKEDLTVENGFLWRIIAKFSKDHNITITYSEESNEDNQQIDAIDVIIPDIPHYCSYINLFVELLLINGHEVNELMEYEFIFKQLLSMAQLLEVGDEAQRQILFKCLNELLENENLFNKIHDYIRDIMKIFSLNSDSNSLLEITVNIIDFINSNDMENEEQTNVDSQELRQQLETKYVTIGVEINKLRSDLEIAKRNDDFLLAQNIKEQIEDLTKQKNEIMEETERSDSETDHIQSFLPDNPLSTERSLQILCACLEFGYFKKINSVLLTLIERLVFPSIISTDISTRSLGVKCLGHSCIISIDFALNYFPLFVEILNFDSDEVQENALKCIFDFLCAHGLSCFENNYQNKPENRYFKDEKKEKDQSFIELFIELMLKHLHSESVNIKLIVVKGIANLMFLDKLQSTLLLSELIKIWFDINSNDEIRQFLGLFLSEMELKSQKAKDLKESENKTD